MQFKIFDVVELKEEKKATIMKIDDNIITCEVIDKNGKNLGIKKVKKEDIIKIIYRNKK